MPAIRHWKTHLIHLVAKPSAGLGVLNPQTFNSLDGLDIDGSFSCLDCLFRTKDCFQEPRKMVAKGDKMRQEPFLLGPKGYFQGQTHSLVLLGRLFKCESKRVPLYGCIHIIQEPPKKKADWNNKPKRWWNKTIETPLKTLPCRAKNSDESRQNKPNTKFPTQ